MLSKGGQKSWEREFPCTIGRMLRRKIKHPKSQIPNPMYNWSTMSQGPPLVVFSDFDGTISVMYMTLNSYSQRYVAYRNRSLHFQRETTRKKRFNVTNSGT